MWTIRVNVILDSFKQWVHNFLVETIDAFLPLLLYEYEPASNQCLKVVGDHALFLVQNFGHLSCVHGAVSQEF